MNELNCLDLIAVGNINQQITITSTVYPAIGSTYSTTNTNEFTLEVSGYRIPLTVAYHDSEAIILYTCIDYTGNGWTTSTGESIIPTSIEQYV